MSIMENQQLFARFEGGAVYTAEAGGKFLVLVNEAAMADLLDAGDNVQQLETALAFSSSDARNDYLQQRYGKLRAWPQSLADE